MVYVQIQDETYVICMVVHKKAEELMKMVIFICLMELVSALTNRKVMASNGFLVLDDYRRALAHQLINKSGVYDLFKWALDLYRKVCRIALDCNIEY